MMFQITAAEDTEDPFSSSFDIIDAKHRHSNFSWAILSKGERGNVTHQSHTTTRVIGSNGLSEPPRYPQLTNKTTVVSMAGR